MTDEIKFDKRNYRKHNAENKRLIKKSLEECGAGRSILIDGEDEIIAGNGVYEQAKKLKMPVRIIETDGSEIVAIKRTDLKTSDEKRKQLAVMDNSTSDSSEFDLELMAEDFSVDQLDGMGVELPEGLLETEPEVVEDEIPEQFETRAKPGDIWKLGKHRLMCGDSTIKENVEKLMDGEKADMVFTDPPYRMEAEGGSNQWVGRSAAKVGEKIKDFCNFNPSKFLEILEIIFEKGKQNSYIFCNKDLILDYLNWAKDKKFSSNVLFWKKPNALPLGEQHRPDVEYIIFVRKNSVWNNGIKGVCYSKCLEYNRENIKEHPTVKPVGLICNEILISSKKGNCVVDFFGGSGSTLIACEQLGRICYMAELDPKYCDVILQRYENFTGDKPVLLERKE